MNKIVNQKYQETYYTKILPSGLQVIAMPKDPSYTTHVSLLFPFGAKHLEFTVNGEIKKLPEGVAHFFEHKIFASKEGDMFTKFVSLGLDANAMTGYESTQYVFSATNHVYEGLDLLLNTVDTTYFTDENVRKERDIINEEIQMNNDRLYTKMFRHLRNMMYHTHPIKTDILGTKETIATITKETLLDVHQYVYQDHQRVLLISGNVDIQELDRYLESLNDRPKGHFFPTFKDLSEPKEVVMKHQVIEENIAHETLMFGLKLHGLSKGITYEKQISAIYMLLHGIFGASSNFSQILLDEQLVKKELNYHLERLLHAEAVVLYSETNDPEQLLTKIKTEFEKPLEALIDEATFVRYKKVSLANQIEMLDQQEQKIDIFAQYFIEGLDLFEVLDAKNELTYEDLREAYQLIRTSDSSSLILKPAKTT